MTSTPVAVTVPDQEQLALEVRNLSVQFRTRTGIVQALDDVSFSMKRSEILGVVGESGCGKSTLGLSIMRLLPTTAAMTGSALLAGRDVFGLSRKELSGVRGGEIGMVFQDPMKSLNPSMPVGKQVQEVLLRHTGLSRQESLSRVQELLTMVGIPDAANRLRDYPHQFSGGMRQRVVIAIALACEPRVLIADEPTTALDVTVEAQILDLLKDLQDRLGISILLISHNMRVIARMSQRTMVMYAGRKIEEGPTPHVLARARHPYTRRLVEAVPNPETKSRLREIPGMVPTLTSPARSCAFADRCPRATEVCFAHRPELESIDQSHDVACFHPEEY
jgi:oligopeptide/dipeptide ABC transporter ATP-binding protein